MKVVITKTETFERKKDGARFTKICGLKQSGESFEIVTTAEKWEGFKVNADTDVASPEDIKDFFDTSPNVEIQFNEKGFLEDVVK